MSRKQRDHDWTEVGSDEDEEGDHVDVEERTATGFAALRRRVEAETAAASDTRNSIFRLESGTLKHGVALREYQTDGVAWLSRRFAATASGGAILADEMGLGKTLQTIAFLLHIKNHNLKFHNAKYLIVTPLSVLHNWVEEIEKFAPPGVVNVCKYHGTKEERTQLREDLKDGQLSFHVLLTTYETAISDSDFIQSIQWKVLVVDEAHRLKNAESRLYLSLKLLQTPKPFVVLLTGTPIMNNLMELEALLCFACPNVFGEVPVGNLERMAECLDEGDGVRNNKGMGKFYHFLQPFMLRRDKETVLTLPPMTETVLYTPMTALQRSLYKSILTKDLSAFDSTRKTGLMNILMQLRKCCNHPYLFDGIEPEPFEAGDHLYQASGKLAVLDGILQHLHANGHRVLIFSQMTHMLDILQDYLTYQNYTLERLDGSIRGQDRANAVHRFTASSSKGPFVFLLSTRAGGVGLNLTAADTVVFFDSDFNPMMDMQAAARAHRMGQPNPVRVLRLLTEGSVEEVLFRRARAKRALSGRVLGDGAADLVSALRFGLDGIVRDGNPSGEGDFAARVDALVREFCAGPSGGVVDVAEEGDREESIYVYEGKDYKRDEDALERLRGEVSAAVAPQVDVAEVGREQKAREARMRRDAKVKERWAKIGYTSYALEDERGWEDAELESLSGNDGWEEGDDQLRLRPSDDDAKDWFTYKTGSITDPAVTARETGIIVHVVDDSGNWPDRGVFGALSQLDPNLAAYYIASHEAKNLSLGSAHLLHNDIKSRSGGTLRVCFIVAQKRSRDGSLGEIRFPDLQAGLLKLGNAAKLMKASVHLPRFGQDTALFDWYQTERIIRKCLPARRVQTVLYYFRRKAISRNVIVPSPAGSSNATAPVLKRANSIAVSSSSDGAKLLKRSSSTIENDNIKKPRSSTTSDSYQSETAAIPDALIDPDAIVQPDRDKGKVVVFMYDVRDTDIQKAVLERVYKLGGTGIGNWDRQRVTVVVVPDAATKADLLDGSKSTVSVMTVSEFLQK